MELDSLNKDGHKYMLVRVKYNKSKNLKMKLILADM